MNALVKISSSNKQSTPQNITWCEESNYIVYEYFMDFNEWFEGCDD